MAEKLSVQIALEGGQAVEQALAGIGTAGKKCFDDISAAAAKVGGFDKLAPDQATKSMEKFGITTEDTMKKVTEAVKTASRLETIVNTVKAVENAFTSLGTTVGKVITLFGKHEAAAAGLGRTGVAAATAISNAFGPVGPIILVVLGVVALVATAFVKAIEQVRALDSEARTLGSTFEKTSQVFAGLRAAGISSFAVIHEAMQQLKSDIATLTLAQVAKDFADAQKNIAAGWGPTTEQIARLRQVATGAGTAATAAGQAAREALATLGQPIRDNVTPALESMVRWAGDATKAIPLLGNELKSMGDAGERARLVSELINRIKVESGDAVTATRPLLELLQGMASGTARNAAVSQAFSGAMGIEVQQLLDAGVSIADIIKKMEGMKQGQADAANQIAQTFNRIKAASEAAFTNVPIEALNTAINGIGPTATTAFGQATTAVGTTSKAMDDLNAKIAMAVSGMSKLSGAGGASAADTSGGFAGGGMIGGRGTGTSDSNLAWVSRGEHIMPARAVAQPGVLAFLEALRRTGGDLSSVMRGMGRFALGGLVSAAPSFAGGGISSMSHVTIAFPGLQPITGLRASATVVDELRHAAAMAQVRSGGRKPSRYS